MAKTKTSTDLSPGSDHPPRNRPQVRVEAGRRAGHADLLRPDRHQGQPQEKPTWFAGVRLGKQYVSYYLMPVYGHKALLGKAPEALTRRMQGKACFNFKAVDDGLFRDLAKLTKAGCDCFKKVGYL